MKVGIRIGDLAQIRRVPHVVIRAPSDIDPFYLSVNELGQTIRHSAKEVSFLAPQWSFSSVVLSRPQTSTASLNKSTPIFSTPVALSNECAQILASSNISTYIFKHLSKFAEVADRLVYEHSKKLQEAYAYFLDKNGGKCGAVSVSDVARWVFLTDSPRPAEMYAVNSFLMRNQKWFFLDRLSVSGLPSIVIYIDALYRMRDPKEVETLIWFEKQTKGSLPGKELKLFLDKANVLIEWAEKSPGINPNLLQNTDISSTDSQLPDITFTDSDRIFLESIKQTACNRTANPYSDLVSRGILSRLTGGYSKKPAFRAFGSGPVASGRAQDATRLLKDLGVIRSWENTEIMGANTTGGALDGIPGHGFSKWAQGAVSESEIWAKKLLSGPSVPDTTFESVTVTSKAIAEEFKSPADSIDNASLLSVIRDRTVLPQHTLQDEFISKDAFSLRRRDFGDIPVYVIDSPTAQELDDGISIEHTAGGTWIHTHIADPTALIPVGHPLAMLAQLRGTSMYLPERHYPMLPDELSSSKFNLGKNNFAMTFSCRLGSDGEIIDYKVAPSIINNVKILHYRVVNRILDWSTVYGISAPREQLMPWVKKAHEEVNKVADSSLSETTLSDLRELQSLARLHLKLRISRGGFISDQPEFGVKVTPFSFLPESPRRPFDGHESRPPLVILDPNQSNHLEPASNMVSECMIMANRVAARFCSENAIPAIYRGQNSLQINSQNEHIVASALGEIDQISGVLPFRSFRSLLPYFSSASISTSPMNHYSLGIKASEFGGYMKVTSPLRRYKDMMLHWLMKDHLLGNNPSFSSEDVLKISTRLHEIEKRTDKIASYCSDYWALEWILRREVLGRIGADSKIVSLGVDKPTGLEDIGIAMPGLNVGPRGPVVWGGSYRGSVEWGRSQKWQARTIKTKTAEIVYHCVLSSLYNSGKSGQGLLGDLGGLRARIDLKSEWQVGDIVKCRVDTVDPAAGILLLEEC